MEERVVVLGRSSLIILAAGLKIVLVIAFVQGTSRKAAALDSRPESLGAHLASTSGLLRYQAMFVILGTQLGIVVTTLRPQSDALCGGACCCVCNSGHGDNGPKNDRHSTSTTRADQRVTVVVIGLHGDGGQREVGTVHSNHSGLRQTRARVGFLNSRLYRHERDDQEDKQVDLRRVSSSAARRNREPNGTYRNCGLVHRAATLGKEDVHQDRHHNRGHVHAQGRPDEQATPHARVTVFDLLQA